MNYILLYTILCGTLLANSVVTINKTTYTESDFYKEYGKKEWLDSKPNQKKDLIDDFINRRIATLEATNIGLQNKPDIAQRLHNRYYIALVNQTYEELVARPLISSESLEQTKAHIVEERLLSHILIGHNALKSQDPPDRTIDDAFLMAQNISNELRSGKSFTDYAIKYSDDPTVFQNEGKLDWIGWGRTIPAFQNQAFLLKKGEYSRPVLTDFGYHIIFCEDIRESEYASLNQAELEEIAYMVARNSIAKQLGDAADAYDAKQFSNYNVQYNNKALDVILDIILKQTSKNKISGQYKVDLIKLFANMTDIGVVAMFDNKGYGIKWFAENLKMIPSGRHPQIVNLESLQQAFKIVILQYLAVQEAYKNNVDQHPAYIKQKQQLYQSLLYDQYLRWLVNNANTPDSIAIQQYYHDNKDQKYFEGKKVSVREIKVYNKDLADSLFLELKYGESFITLAEEYSKTNPTGGGLITPFTEGKYNEMGQIAFNLKAGQMSEIIVNLDRSYSIILVEGFVEPEHIPLEKVSTRIESILKRDYQKLAKENGLTSLRDKYNVIINTGFYVE